LSDTTAWISIYRSCAQIFY